MRCSWAKSTYGAWSSGTESVKAESLVVLVLAEGGSVSRRRCVTGSTSKTVIAGVILGNRGFRCGVKERRGDVSAKNFSGVL